MRGIKRRFIHHVLFLTTLLFVLGSTTPALAHEPGLVGKSIVVDAGHGGPDGGARTQDGQLEKHITLAIALELANLLRQGGAVVHLTRTMDKDLATDRDRELQRRHKGDLRERLRFVRRHDGDALVSIHCNAVPSPEWRGAQVIYMTGNEQGKRLADVMQDVFRAHLLPTSRQPQKMDTLYLLKRVKGPAVLAEVGFLSNPDESHHLLSPVYQKRVATVIYIALLQYFGESRNSNIQGEHAARSQPG